MPTRAVIFDMDGVLIDSYRAHFRAWQAVGERLGRTLTEEEFAATFGRRNREIFRTLWGEAISDTEAERLGEWKENVYRDLLREDFPKMDGAEDLVDALAAAGFRLAIGSSGPPGNIEVAVEGLGRPGAFDATVSGADVTHGKPDPEVFLTAAEKLGVEPAACAVVEDAPAGIEAARRAGMTPVAVTGTAPRKALEAAGAARVVESLRELSPEGLAALIDARPA